jgi:hypothetical protein
MRKVVVLALTSVFAVTFFASCKKQDAEKDKAAVRALVEGDTTRFNSGTSGDSTEGAPLTEDTTVGIWWRGPQTHDSVPTIEVQVQGDSAWVGWPSTTTVRCSTGSRPATQLR